MNNCNEKNKIIEKIAHKLIESETREWPPTCLGFIYQPQRPRKVAIKYENEKNFCQRQN